MLRTERIETFIATVNEQRNLPNDHFTHDPDGLTSIEIEKEVEMIAYALQEQYQKADDSEQAREEPSGVKLDEWSDPESIDTGLLPVPAFDLRLIPPALRPWIAEIADRAQCPLDFLGMGAIVSAGALVARTLAIRPKRYDDWPVVSNLWGGIIAPPGFLKSPMIAEILKPVRSLAYDAAKRFEQAKRDYESNVVVENAKRANIEQKIKAVIKEKVAGGPAAEKTRDATIETLRAKLAELASEPPRQARFEITDPSVEKLGEILNQNPGGALLVRDELTGFLRSLERQGHEGDRAFYCEAWNGLSPYSFDRIGRGTIHIGRICVSIFGGIQPGKWNSYLREAFTDGENDGFMNRFQMTAWPDRPGPWHNVDRWPDTVAKKTAVSIYKALAELEPMDLGAEPTEVGEFPYLRFAPAAQDLFNAWRSDLEAKVRHPEEHPILVSHLGKYRSLMPALALVFHAVARVADSDDSIGVSQSAATLAAAWCDYLEAHARRCYQSVTDATNSAGAALALKVRRGKLTSPFSARDIYRPGSEGLSDRDEAGGRSIYLRRRSGSAAKC
jgi:hypothetical protein